MIAAGKVAAYTKPDAVGVHEAGAVHFSLMRKLFFLLRRSNWSAVPAIRVGAMRHRHLVWPGGQHGEEGSEGEDERRDEESSGEEQGSFNCKEEEIAGAIPGRFAPTRKTRRIRSR